MRGRFLVALLWATETHLLRVDETMEVTMLEESAFLTRMGVVVILRVMTLISHIIGRIMFPLDKLSTIQSSGNGVASLRMQSLHRLHQRRGGALSFFQADGR